MLDHIAVALFLSQDIPALTLHFPTEWQTKPGPRFRDTGGSDYVKNPGGIANRYHEQFSEKIGENSLMQIQTAIDLAAIIKTHNGFKERNKYIADSEFLVAFTWGEGCVPKKGGTLDTWEKCKGKKVHIPFSSLNESSLVCKCSPKKRKYDTKTSQIVPVKKLLLCSVDDSEPETDVPNIGSYVGSCEESKPLAITSVVQNYAPHTNALTESHEEPSDILTEPCNKIESSDVISHEPATVTESEQKENDSNAITNTIVALTESHEEPSDILTEPCNKIESSDVISHEPLTVTESEQKENDSNANQEGCTQSLESGYDSVKEDEMSPSQLQTEMPSSPKNNDIKEDHETLSPIARTRNKMSQLRLQTETSNSPDKNDIKEDCETLSSEKKRKTSSYKCSNFIAQVHASSNCNPETSQYLKRDEPQSHQGSQSCTSTISKLHRVCEADKRRILSNGEKSVCKDSHWIDSQSYNPMHTKCNNTFSGHASSKAVKPAQTSVAGKRKSRISESKSKRTKNTKRKKDYNPLQFVCK